MIGLFLMFILCSKCMLTKTMKVLSIKIMTVLLHYVKTVKIGLKKLTFVSKKTDFSQQFAYLPAWPLDRGIQATLRIHERNNARANERL